VAPLQAGDDQLIGLDFRPADGKLYMVMRNSVSGLGHLYTVDPGTGAATFVGPTPGFTITNSSFGVDFNPAVDILRLVGRDHSNFRLNPTTGALISTDAVTAYAPGDPHAGDDPGVAAIAYDRNVPGTAATTLFGYDGAAARLVTVGGPSGTPSPNSGQLFSIADVVSPGLIVFDGIDISAEGTPYVVFTVPTLKPHLGRIDLATGAITDLGAMPAGNVLIGAVAPSSRLQLASSAVSVDEGAGAATVTLTRTGPGTGPASVQYTTIDGSATGADYTGSTGAVAFAQGQTQASLTIPIAQDSANEGTES
jgi:hypothetical protein